jgi:hypothetical protein
MPDAIIGRLWAVLDDYLPYSGDSDIIPPNFGQQERSVKLKLKIARNDAGDTVRVIKKEKTVVGSHDAMINAICKQSHAVLGFYFPDGNAGDPITLTLKVIMQPGHMNIDTPAKSYVVSRPAVLGVCISKQLLEQGIEEEVENWGIGEEVQGW